MSLKLKKLIAIDTRANMPTARDIAKMVADTFAICLSLAIVVTFTKAQVARANSLKKAGRTNNEIAAALGCSVSALYNGIFNKEEK